MKKKTSLSLVLGVALFFLSCQPAFCSLISSAYDTSALDSPIAINFDSETKGTYTNLTIGDVQFIADDLNFRIDDSYTGFYGLSGYYLDNGPYVYTSAGGFHSITFAFTTPVDGFAFKMGWGNYNWELAAYDSAMNLIESHVLNFDGGTEAGKYFGIVADGIAYGKFSFDSSIYGATNDWVSFDEFTYSPVPLPGAIWFLGSGLVGLVGLRKKLKK